ncbi:cation channel sperm-associated protein 1-like [Salminus brasiliensis]|uniref:cation channel sperm-associated protein 1-like n=1 Tax=Salminus brasiliensis TaxID=930266 RepID=UPI003B82E530
MAMMTVFSILCVHIVFSSCRSRQHTNSSPEHDSLSVDEDESRDEFQADDSSVKSMCTWVEQIYDLIFNFTQTPLFTSFILVVVVLDTMLLIAQAFPSLSVRAGWVFSAVDACFLGIYPMEFFLKLLAWGHKYFQNSWNNMDFIIIVMSVVDFTLPLVQTTGLAGGKQTSSVFRL